MAQSGQHRKPARLAPGPAPPALLRYAREWLGLDSRAIKALQETFGQVGDLAFTLRYLGDFEAQGGQVPVYKERLEKRLSRALEAARVAWGKHQASLDTAQ